MPPIVLSADDFLRLGLNLIGFHENRQKSEKTMLRHFSAAFGACPATCSAIFADFQTTTIQGARIDKPVFKWFLVAMNWLFTYKVEEEIAGFFKCDEKTARK